MPGPFAHFTLFHKAKELFMAQSLHPSVQQALGDFSDYGLLGSNSPDFPIVACERLWEEYLHGPTAAAYIGAALSILRPISGLPRQKFLAWFCGYLSHMVGDATIHPVVNLRVGPYMGHEKSHQVCEIHQDAHVYPRLGLVGVTKCNFTRSVIDACCASGNRLLLDPELVEFWQNLSRSAFPREDVPDFSRWFAIYTGIVDKISEEADWFHVRVITTVFRKKHLVQITPDQINQTYIHGLPSPTGDSISYDDLFNKAIENTVKVWLSFATALEDPASVSFPISGSWNLNTGEIVDPQYLFWGVPS